MQTSDPITHSVIGSVTTWRIQGKSPWRNFALLLFSLDSRREWIGKSFLEEVTPELYQLCLSWSLLPLELYLKPLCPMGSAPLIFYFLECMTCLCQGILFRLFSLSGCLRPLLPLHSQLMQSLDLSSNVTFSLQNVTFCFSFLICKMGLLVVLTE